jgi:hypothetical protein
MDPYDFILIPHPTNLSSQRIKKMKTLEEKKIKELREQEHNDTILLLPNFLTDLKDMKLSFNKKINILSYHINQNKDLIKHIKNLHVQQITDDNNALHRSYSRHPNSLNPQTLSVGSIGQNRGMNMGIGSRGIMPVMAAQPQDGGVNYNTKYIKYKTKYIELKNSL